MEEPTYYAIIPAEVRYDKRLTNFQRLLFGEITALTSASGECWAKNEYFQSLYGVTRNTISNSINKLVNLGYLEAQIDTLTDSGNTTKRRTLKMPEGYTKNLTKGIPKKCAFNNTSKNKEEREELDTPLKENFRENTKIIADLLGVKPTKGMDRYVYDVYPKYVLSKATIKMADWCDKNRVAPTSQRWLNWIDKAYRKGELPLKGRS